MRNFDYGPDATFKGLQTAGTLQAGVGLDGPFQYSADIYLESGILQADIVSPERRLSDYLNGFLPCFDVTLLSDRDHADGNHGLLSYRGCVTKAAVLFAVPLPEAVTTPKVPNPAWRPTVKRRCRATIGRWSLDGFVHLDSDHGSEAGLRLMDKQFLPITGATVKRSGEVVGQDVVTIVNRFRLDVLFVELPGGRK